MKNNNGKVAIAIVAMFVVALSVVGFTYAYFTAQVQGNLGNENSVEVGAGIMQIKYEHGSSLTAKNIVPGWISDSFHYYDPIASVKTNPDGSREITAAELTGDKDSKNLPDNTGLTAVPQPGGENAIVANPVTIKITNTGNQVAKYGINLNVSTLDGFSADDIANNLVVYLVSGAWDGNKITSTTLENAVSFKGLSANSVVELDKYEEIAVGNTAKEYYVVLEYRNVASEQKSMNASFSAEVEIVSLGQDATEPVAQD